MHQCVFEHAVHTERLARDEPADGRNIDDRTAVFGHPLGPRHLGPLEGRAQVHFVGLVEARQVAVDHRARPRVGGRVVDQNVQTAKRLRYVSQGRLPLVFVRNIMAQKYCTSSVALVDVINDCAARRLVNISDCDPRTFRHQ